MKSKEERETVEITERYTWRFWSRLWAMAIASALLGPVAIAAGLVMLADRVLASPALPAAVMAGGAAMLGVGVFASSLPAKWARLVRHGRYLCAQSRTIIAAVDKDRYIHNEESRNKDILDGIGASGEKMRAMVDEKMRQTEQLHVHVMEEIQDTLAEVMTALRRTNEAQAKAVADALSRDLDEKLRRSWAAERRSLAAAGAAEASPPSPSAAAESAESTPEAASAPEQTPVPIPKAEPASEQTPVPLPEAAPAPKPPTSAAEPGEAKAGPTPEKSGSGFKDGLGDKPGKVAFGQGGGAPDDCDPDGYGDPDDPFDSVNDPYNF